MSAPASPPVRTGRDPAVFIWVVAGACWILVVGLVLADARGFCHDDDAVASGRMTGPSSGPVATAFAACLVMAGAMMLPTVVPLVRLFVPVTARVPRPAMTRIAFLGGYLAVWAGFAAVAVLGDSGVDALARVRAWPVAPSEPVLAVTLVVAGLFQFSRLKHACLTACRSPWAFLWQYYRRGVRGGWILGLRHGVLCLGCCWALMLIMFGVGAGSLLWMLALTVFMVIEKTTPQGGRLVAPLGGALVMAGITVSVLAVSAVPADPPGSLERPDGLDPGVVALLVAAVGLAALWPVARTAGRRRRTGRGGSRSDVAQQ